MINYQNKKKPSFDIRMPFVVGGISEGSKKHCLAG
jgi:hypothetical protein